MAGQVNNSINNRQSANGETEIDLLQIVRVIWKNLWIIILGGIAGGIIALAVTLFLIEPTYRSSFTAYVNNRTSTNQSTEMISSGDTSAAQQLTHTYAAIMTSRPIVEEAIEAAGLDYRYGSVQNAISTSITSSTALITVNVTLASPNDALALAQALAEVSPDYMENIVEGSSMKVVSYPVLASSQFAPNPKRNTAMGVLIGLVISAPEKRNNACYPLYYQIDHKYQDNQGSKDTSPVDFSPDDTFVWFSAVQPFKLFFCHNKLPCFDFSFLTLFSITQKRFAFNRVKIML